MAGKQLTAALTGLLAMSLLAGCKTAGYVKGDVTAVSLETNATDVRAESRALEVTMTNLTDLVNMSAGDLRPQFQRYSSALDQLVAANRRVSTAVARLSKKSAAYFAAWDKQLPTISDEALRKQSEARKVEVSNQYETTFRHYQEAQSSLVPVIEYLLDIRKALSADLTPSGLQAAKPAFNNATERAARVQTKLAQTASELDALGAKMSSFVPPAGK